MWTISGFDRETEWGVMEVGLPGLPEEVIFRILGDDRDGGFPISAQTVLELMPYAAEKFVVNDATTEYFLEELAD